MYSMAPFTEAAVMALYCGQNTMSNGGYLERFNNTPETIFESFKRNGYETFYNSYQPHVFPSSMKRGVDNNYYNVAFNFNSFWTYRMDYYEELYKENKLTQSDWDYIIRATDDNLTEWKNFLQKVKFKDESVCMIINNFSDYDIDKDIKVLNDEILKFNLDKRAYIEEIFKVGREHRIFSIKELSQNNKVKSKEAKDKITKEYYDVFKQIKSINFKKNLVNNSLNFKKALELSKEFFKHPSKENLIPILKYLFIYYKTLVDVDLIERAKENYDEFKAAPSVRTHFNNFINWIDKKRNNDKPYFAVMHVDDIHHPEMFFTYDTDDTDIIDEEFKNIKDYISSLPKNYKGNLAYDL